MGRELECRLRQGRKTFCGKAYLETDFVLFRGDGQKLKILLNELTAVSSEDRRLNLQHSGGPYALELGAYATKWADKILHPPSLRDKLGIKAGMEIAIDGEFDRAFLKEIGTPAAGKSDIVFLPGLEKLRPQ